MEFINLCKVNWSQQQYGLSRSRVLSNCSNGFNFCKKHAFQQSLKQIRFEDPHLLSQHELSKIFNEFYKDNRDGGRKIKPTYSNFKNFIKILAREFLLLNFHPRFFTKGLAQFRPKFFELAIRLALENSKPAVEAQREQKTAITAQEKYDMYKFTSLFIVRFLHILHI